MAEAVVQNEFSPKCFDEKVGLKNKSDYDLCLNLKREIQILHEEISSAKLIIKLLQTEGNPIDSSTNQERNYDAISEWKIVLANKEGARGPITVQQAKPIPTIINRYKVLENLHIQSPTHLQPKYANSFAKKEHSRATNSISTGLLSKRSEINNKKTQAKKRGKIIIIGDNHARGCAQEIQHNLEYDYEIQGIVKPGASLQSIVNTPRDSFGKLTKKDVIVLWGGTCDVGRNESTKGLYQIRSFVEKLKHTNVIVMSVPYRHDLAPNSCVKHEVKVFNSKLRKYLKVHENTCVLEVDSDCNLFTRHGLHMNLKGKEHITCKTIKMIKAMLHKEKSVPIRLKYIDDLVMPNSEPVGMTTTTSPIMNQDNSEKDRQSNAESVTVPTDTLSIDTGGNRLPSRLRKPPKSFSKDFLW